MNDRAVIALACQIAKLRDKARMWKQTALAYENEGMSARADAVTRAEQDRVRMEALRDELRREREAHAGLKDALGIQAAKEAGKVLGMIDGEGLRGAAERVVKQRDALRADVEDLRTLCDQWKQRETALLADIERLKKPARQHPVKVGEWVRRTIGSDKGMSAQVKGIAVLQYDVEYDGVKAFWASRNCEPCDPPTEATHDTPEGKQAAESAIKREPKPGDVVRLVREPTHTDIPAMLPWSNAFGMPGDTATVVIMAVPDKLPNGTIPVRTSKGQAFFWPLSCIEVVKGGDK